LIYSVHHRRTSSVLDDLVLLKTGVS